ncbi:MAG TPA: restriction endonuclease [Streptosporangiaceae bacterium]
MAEKILVTQGDLADGARLIQQLDQADFPVTAAFWAHDPALERWRFIIAAPASAIESLVSAYRVIQRVISENGLAISLDRVSLIPDNDSALANLQALGKSDAQDAVEVSIGRTEIAGIILDDIHVYRRDALRFERTVIAALQRMQPSNTILRRNVGEADAVLDDGERLIIVEIRDFTRLLGIREVYQAEGFLQAYGRTCGRPVAAMIVSRNGFSVSAIEEAQNSRISLVQWTGPEDDQLLQSALEEARAA